MAAASGEQWSSRYAFLMAAIGSAVGLGNIWRFPYLAGENGGGAFVLIYIACVVLIALPVLVAELMLGRHGHKDPIAGVAAVAEESGKSRYWGIVGGLGALSGFLIVTFYSVIAGWALEYVFVTGAGTFKGKGSQEIATTFDGLLADPVRLTLWHTIFMGLTVFIVARGVQGGIEKAVKILMPAFFALLAIMVIYGSLNGNLGQALNFLFAPDFSKITGPVILTAIGQAFFSVGITMGIMITYGSYLPSHVSIPRAAGIIVVADTGVALLAGLMIFPILFAAGLAPGQGSGLVFKTLPIAFGSMTLGTVIGTAFFLLLTFAALTSSISMIQPAVSWVERKWTLSPRRAAIYMGLLAWAIGLTSVMGLSIWSDLKPLGFIDLFAETNVMDTWDGITAKITMPLAGLFVAIFAGWFMLERIGKGEFGEKEGAYYNIWRFLSRFVAPLGVAAVLIQVLLL